MGFKTNQIKVFMFGDDTVQPQDGETWEGLVERVVNDWLKKVGGTDGIEILEMRQTEVHGPSYCFTITFLYADPYYADMQERMSSSDDASDKE